MTTVAAPVLWQNRIVGYGTEAPDQLLANPQNWRIHPALQQATLEGVLTTVGLVQNVIVNQTTGHIVDGHLRVTLALRSNQPSIPVTYVSLTEDEERLILSTYDPLSALAGQDDAILADLLAEVQTGDAAVQALLDSLATDAGAHSAGADDEDADETPVLGDALFPSDNEWGVPTLDLKLQAVAVAPPVERWGRMARHGAVSMPGTYHFYTEDYKFAALWDDPAPLVDSGCAAVIEPNYSTYTAMPPALALYAVYRKRYLARWWQAQGVQVLVDLNVEPQFDKLNLLGVPRGWRAYATRAYDGLLPDVARQFTLAAEHAGTDDLLFVVLGGGNAMQQEAGVRGWVWIPQENHVVEGRYGA